MDRPDRPTRTRHRAAAQRALHPGLFAAAALLLCGARPFVEVDSSWVAPGLRADRLFSVAVLPVARLAGEADVAHQVASGWLRHNPAVGAVRLDEAESVIRIAGPARERDSLLAQAAREITGAGRPAPATARWLARHLGVVALVALRVDRWEAGSGAQDMAYVDLTATLVDSTGRLLWRSAGRARAEAARSPTHMPGLPVTVASSGYRVSTGSSGGSASSSASSGGPSAATPGAQTGGGSSSPSAAPAPSTTTSSAPPGGVVPSSQSGALGYSTRSSSNEWSREERRPAAPFAAALDTLLSVFSARLAGGVPAEALR